MTVDIAAVAEQARRVQVEPFGASVGHSEARVWEKAARALAEERDASQAAAAELHRRRLVLLSRLTTIAEDASARTKVAGFTLPTHPLGEIASRLRALLHDEGAR